MSQICHSELAGCGWDWGHMGCSVIAHLSLSETIWQAGILQINEEGLSISSGIRHFINQCVIASFSIFFRAENPLRIPRYTANIFVRIVFRRFQVLYIHSLVQSLQMTQEVSYIIKIPFFFLRYKPSQFRNIAFFPFYVYYWILYILLTCEVGCCYSF